MKKNKFSELSQSIINSNLYGKENDPEKVKEFIKEIRGSLRFDFEMKAPDVRKLNDNAAIEKWYEFNRIPENRIGGA